VPHIRGDKGCKNKFAAERQGVAAVKGGTSLARRGRSGDGDGSARCHACPSPLTIAWGMASDGMERTRLRPRAQLACEEHYGKRRGREQTVGYSDVAEGDRNRGGAVHLTWSPAEFALGIRCPRRSRGNL
jgi:hypothetical protein